MQWRRQKRVTHVIGSSNHVLLLARYQDGTETPYSKRHAMNSRVESSIENVEILQERNESSPLSTFTLIDFFLLITHRFSNLNTSLEA